MSGAGVLACTASSDDAPNPEEKPTTTAEGGAPRGKDASIPEATRNAATEGDSGIDGGSAIDAGSELDSGAPNAALPQTDAEDE